MTGLPEPEHEVDPEHQLSALDDNFLKTKVGADRVLRVHERETAAEEQAGVRWKVSIIIASPDNRGREKWHDLELWTTHDDRQRDTTCETDNRSVPWMGDSKLAIQSDRKPRVCPGSHWSARQTSLDARASYGMRLAANRPDLPTVLIAGRQANRCLTTYRNSERGAVHGYAVAVHRDASESHGNVRRVHREVEHCIRQYRRQSARRRLDHDRVGSTLVEGLCAERKRQRERREREKANERTNPNGSASLCAPVPPRDRRRRCRATWGRTAPDAPPDTVRASRAHRARGCG